MKLSLKTSGGIGNIQLQGVLNTNDLPAALAEKVLRVLTPTQLNASRPADMAPMADAIQYEINLFLDSGIQSFEIDDLTAPPDVLDTVQELVQALIHQKRAPQE
jgi:hypothetical protein